MGLLDKSEDVLAEMLGRPAFDTDGKSPITMLLTVDVSDKLDAACAITDMAERIAYLETTYREAKRPILHWLATYVPVIKLVNELASTSQMVLKGPESAWRFAMGRHGLCLLSHGISLAPNDPEWELNDGVLSRVRT